LWVNHLPLLYHCQLSVADITYGCVSHVFKVGSPIDGFAWLALEMKLTTLFFVTLEPRLRIQSYVPGVRFLFAGVVPANSEVLHTFATTAVYVGLLSQQSEDDSRVETMANSVFRHTRAGSFQTSFFLSLLLKTRNNVGTHTPSFRRGPTQQMAVTATAYRYQRLGPDFQSTESSNPTMLPRLANPHDLVEIIHRLPSVGKSIRRVAVCSRQSFMVISAAVL